MIEDDFIPNNLDHLFDHLRKRYKDWEYPSEYFVKDTSSTKKSGSFGSVSFGTLKNKQGKVAVKTFKQQKELYKEIWREMLFLMSRISPYCLDFIGYIINKKKISVITPRIKNGTLTSNISKLSGTQKTKIAAFLALGMSSLHQCEKIHLDLKTDNILIDDYFNPIISDFGSIKNEHTIEITPKVTNGYTAPEVYKGEWTKAADVYSYGVILNQMMTGKSPLEDSSICQTTPEGLKNLINTCKSDIRVRPTFPEIIEMFQKKEIFYPDTDFMQLPVISVDPIDYSNLIERLDSEFPKYKIDKETIKITSELKKRGGFGEVTFGVMEKKNGKVIEVAVKEIYNTKSMIAEIWREIQTMIILENPFAAKLLGFYIHKGTIYLVQKYFKGGSLDTHIFEGDDIYTPDEPSQKLTGTQKTIIAAGLAHVLSRLNEMGLGHLDLKPENVLMDEKMIPHLSDFGSVKYFGTRRVGLKTTDEYVDPILLEYISPPSCSSKHDVYSYGLILAEMLNERRSKWTRNIGHLITPRSCPKKLKSLINWCLNKEPNTRPAFFEIFMMFQNHSVYFPGTDFEVLDSVCNMTKGPCMLESLINFDRSVMSIIGASKSVITPENAISEVMSNIQNILLDDYKSEKELKDSQRYEIYDLIIKTCNQEKQFAIELTKKTNSQHYLKFDNDLYAKKAFEIEYILINHNPDSFIESTHIAKRMECQASDYPCEVLEFYRILLKKVCQKKEDNVKKIIKHFIEIFDVYCGTELYGNYYKILTDLISKRPDISIIRYLIRNIKNSPKDIFKEISSFYKFILISQEEFSISEKNIKKLGSSVIEYLINHKTNLETKTVPEEDILSLVVRNVSICDAAADLIKLMVEYEIKIDEIIENHIIGQILDPIKAAEVIQQMKIMSYDLSKIFDDPGIPKMASILLTRAIEEPSVDRGLVSNIILLIKEKSAHMTNEQKQMFSDAGFFSALANYFINSKQDEKISFEYIIMATTKNPIIVSDMAALIPLLLGLMKDTVKTLKSLIIMNNLLKKSEGSVHDQIIEAAIKFRVKEAVISIGTTPQTENVANSIISLLS